MQAVSIFRLTTSTLGSLPEAEFVCSTSRFCLVDAHANVKYSSGEAFFIFHSLCRFVRLLNASDEDNFCRVDDEALLTLLFLLILLSLK